MFAASYLVLIQDQKVLLQRRYQTGWMDGMYAFAAGHIESQETAIQAMAREAKEEIDITIGEDGLTVAHILQRYAGNREYFDVYLTATAWEGEPKICEPDKSDDLKWFELDALPENMVPYDKQALECIQKNISYSTYGYPPEL
jgi:8-oxo-dGTP pyrophosphatase MutT (NUDIX family)